jgi:hypothetical protein
MALARVVAFEDVDPARMDEMRGEIEQGDRPESVPATEFLLLHDPESRKALAVMFFESDEDYRTGDEALDAMPPGETPGRRASVTRYEVTARMSV